MTENIGIIGLGRVGMPTAEAYLNAGYHVYGYDVRPEAMVALENLGGRPKASPEGVALQAKTILVMVLNDAQLIEVITGKTGLLRGIRSHSTIVCMSTVNRQNLEFVAEACARQEVRFVDCPFSGGPARIPDRNLTLIAAADHQALASVKTILKVIGHVVYAGERPGLGQAIKHCNQLLVGATHAATMEVIALARKLELEPALVCKVLADGIAGSDYFRLLSDSVLTHKPSPGGLGQMAKDVSIVLNTSRDVKMPAFVATAVSQYFLMAEALGMQDREGADLIEVVELLSAPRED